MIARFQSINNPKERYASFDYCYHYFRTSSPSNLLSDMEKSCLVIGFYLASWGMFRGSSFLLKKSVKYYEPLVEYIADINKGVWEIDVDSYTKENMDIILDVYNQIKTLMIKNRNADLVLVTKIMLGVFANIPAFDTYFCNTFRGIFDDCGFRRVNEKSLGCIKLFYEYNKAEIDELSSKTFVKEFATGKASQFTYTKAKIIDMYGFSKG